MFRSVSEQSSFDGKLVVLVCTADDVPNQNLTSKFIDVFVRMSVCLLGCLGIPVWICVIILSVVRCI